MKFMDRKFALIEFISNEILHNSNSLLAEDDDLLKTGILNSLVILQLVSFIEETFDVQIPDEDIIADNFRNIIAIDQYLNNYI
jgi:acyl carrier protein